MPTIIRMFTAIIVDYLNTKLQGEFGCPHLIQLHPIRVSMALVAKFTSKKEKKMGCL